MTDTTRPGPSEPAIASTRRLLRYSSSLSAAEFDARCRALSWWYHSYYFDNGLSVRGDYDIGADVADYGFPESMAGLRVLDIGTGAGWFAFYFEQLGAEVVTVDARGYCDFDVYGRPGYPSVEEEGRSPDRLGEDGAPIYFSPVSRGFWIMKDILQSSVQFLNSRVYDIGPALFNGRKFDLVFLGTLLCHLRDPIGALMAARSVCRHRVIASTPVVLGETEPDILPRQYLPYTDIDKISWWLPNEACFKHWFLAAGFTGVDVSQQTLLRADLLHFEGGRTANGDQTIRIGSAFVPRPIK
jgi:SAM-dependent methyltransferase